MKRKIHVAAAAIIILLGIVHLAAGFILHRGLSADFLWFLGTGLAMLFCGGLNLIYVKHPSAGDVRLAVRIANVVILLFIALAVVILGLKGNPQVIVLLVVAALMLGLSFSY